MSKRNPACRRYQVTVGGRLSDIAAGMFAGFDVRQSHGQTVIGGERLDQAALVAVLVQLNAVGLILLAVDSSPIDQKRGA